VRRRRQEDVDESDDHGRLAACGRKDLIALAAAAIATLAIAINALFLQSGPHPAPIFANAPASAARETKAAPAAAPETKPEPKPNVILPRPRGEPARPDAYGARPRAELPAPIPVATGAPRQNDPIAELLAPSHRISAVQSALAAYGYGQIEANGMLGPETQAAIEQFERARKLPVTGQISPRLLRELAAVTGRAIE
jgi:hypothetical protein